MSDPTTLSEIEGLKDQVIILGGVIAGLTVVTSVLVIISLFCVYRIFQRLKEITFVTKNARLDVRKTLEVLENAVKRNPAAMLEDDGSERVSPIFTRRIFTPTPLPFDLGILRESGEFENTRKNPLMFGNDVRSLQNGPPPVPSRGHNLYGDY